MVRWMFYDGTTTYTFEVNPNAGGSPQFSRRLSSEATSAPDGVPLVFEGSPVVPKGKFSGVALSQAQVEALQTWYAKLTRLQMTDDLGRIEQVFLTELNLKPSPHRRFPWRHTYTCSYVVLSPVDILGYIQLTPSDTLLPSDTLTPGFI